MGWFGTDKTTKKGSLPSGDESDAFAGDDARGDRVATTRTPFTADSGHPAPMPAAELLGEHQGKFLTLKRRLHQEVVGAIDMAQMRSLSDLELRDEIFRRATAICRQDPELRNLQEREKLIEQVMNEAFGYGPIEELMADPEVSDILINGPRQVYVEKRGQLSLSKVAFHDENHLMHILQRVVAPAGRRIDENSPMVDARLPDGDIYILNDRADGGLYRLEPAP